MHKIQAVKMNFLRRNVGILRREWLWNVEDWQIMMANETVDQTNIWLNTTAERKGGRSRKSWSTVARAVMEACYLKINEDFKREAWKRSVYRIYNQQFSVNISTAISRHKNKIYLNSHCLDASASLQFKTNSIFWNSQDFASIIIENNGMQHVENIVPLYCIVPQNLESTLLQTVV